MQPQPHPPQNQLFRYKVRAPCCSKKKNNNTPHRSWGFLYFSFFLAINLSVKRQRDGIIRNQYNLRNMFYAPRLSNLAFSLLPFFRAIGLDDATTFSCCKSPPFWLSHQKKKKTGKKSGLKEGQEPSPWRDFLPFLSRPHDNQKSRTQWISFNSWIELPRRSVLFLHWKKN